MINKFFLKRRLVCLIALTAALFTLSSAQAYLDGPLYKEHAVYPGIQFLKTEPGWDTVLRRSRPDLPYNKYSLPMLRKREIQDTERDYSAVFRFKLPESVSTVAMHAAFKLYILSPSVEDISINVYGIKDGSEGDGATPLEDLTWKQAAWNLADTESMLMPIGVMHYRAESIGLLELIGERSLVNFINQDRNGYLTLLLKVTGKEGKDLALSYNGGWEAEFDGRISPTLEIAPRMPRLDVGESILVPIIERYDPETGLLVRQLSQFPGFNQGNYYHDNPIAADRTKVVFRNVDEVQSVSKRGWLSHQYFLVDVKTGLTTALTEKGYVNSGQIRGDWFYYLRDATGRNENRISRVHLSTFKMEDLVMEPGGFSVNADGTKIVLNRRTTLPGANPLSIESENFMTTLSVMDIETREETEFFTEQIRVSHLQCSPTDPDRFHFIENSPGIIPDLKASTRALLLGSISTGAWGPLVSGDSFIDSFKNFAHPWWGIDGRLWSDTMKQTQGDTGGFVGNGIIAFDLGDPPAGPYPAPWGIKRYNWFDAENADWQHHANKTSAPYWHVGEGADPIAHRAGRRGRPFIQLFFADLESGTAEFYSLCRQHWDIYQGLAGYAGANPHFISMENGVVFQDRIDFEQASLRTMNIFQVVIPQDIRSRIGDY